jgi:hypothetical protein
LIADFLCGERSTGPKIKARRGKGSAFFTVWMRRYILFHNKRHPLREIGDVLELVE